MNDSNTDSALYHDSFCLQKQGHLDEALKGYEKFLKTHPNDPKALLNIGGIYYNRQEYKTAFKYFHLSLAYLPAQAFPHIMMALLYSGMGQDEAAKIQYRLAELVNPTCFGLYINWSNIYLNDSDYPAAVALLRKHLNLHPDDGYALSTIVGNNLKMMQWDNLDEDIAHLNRLAEEGDGRVNSWNFMLFCTDPQLLLQVSLNQVAHLQKPLGDISPPPPRRRKASDKIRVGYWTGDLKKHPIAYITAHLYSDHNRDDFEIYLYNILPSVDSPLTDYIKAHADHVCDLSAMDDISAYNRIRADELDIFVDLLGYTAGFRAGVIFRKPAPVMINYLGYIGTMAHACYDYIIADAYLIPEEHQKYYTETPLYVDCVYASSRMFKECADISRADFGLPFASGEGVLVCAFNQICKITPQVFDAWMQILRACDNACLWMSASTDFYRDNLLRHAERRGVSENRFHFSEHASAEIHQARYKFADLALDTFPYNGGMTSLDALYDGCPLLTLCGQTMMGRVGAMLLNHLGLQELIADDVDDYVGRAIALIRQPEKLADLRAIVQTRIKDSPIYNGEAMTLQLETCYRAIMNHE